MREPIKPIGRFLGDELLRRLGMPADVRALAQVAEVWSRIAGEPLASEVRPLRYHEGRLVLRASAGLWANKLRHQHDSLKTRLQAEPLMRDLRALEVRVTPGGAGREVVRRLPKPRPISHQTRELLESVAEHVADPNLAAALRRLGGREAK